MQPDGGWKGKGIKILSDQFWYQVFNIYHFNSYIILYYSFIIHILIVD